MIDDEKKMMVSVVIPCYNSEKTIGKLVEMTSEVLKNLNYNYEFILVNDFSKDKTFEETTKLAKSTDYVVAVDLAKNSGQHNALMTAFRYVRGDIIVGMDDDMQTHPSQLHKILDKLNEGYDLVYGKYNKKKESPIRLFFSKLNNYTLGKMINQPSDVTTSSYWAAKRFLVDEVKKYPHSFSNVRGLFFRSTGNVADVEIEHFKREYGKSNYNFKSLIKLWSSCLNFSIIPLRIFLIIGMIASTVGFIGFLVILIRRLIGYTVLTGWSSLMCALSLSSGIVLMCLGVIGEYVGRIFMCINYTPQSVIREVIDNREDE